MYNYSPSEKKKKKVQLFMTKKMNVQLFTYTIDQKNLFTYTNFNSIWGIKI